MAELEMYTIFNVNPNEQLGNNGKVNVPDKLQRSLASNSDLPTCY